MTDDLGGPSEPERLGAAIRTLRRERGLTLVQVAESAGLSHPFLSQLERGLTTPSIASLSRIARALGSSQVEILAVARGEQPDGLDPLVVRAGDGPSGAYGAGRARLLTTGATRFQPIDFRGDSADPGEYYVHEEDEFVTVLEGLARIDLEAHGVHLLAVGDSLYYPGGTRHRWSSGDGGVYRMLVVKDRLEPHERVSRLANPLSAELPGGLDVAAAAR